LDLDERADFRVLTHFTAVQVDEFRQPDTRTQLHVGSDTLIVVHSWMTLPLSLRDWSAASRSLTTREPATPSLSGVRFRVTQSMNVVRILTGESQLTLMWAIVLPGK